LEENGCIPESDFRGRRERGRDFLVHLSENFVAPELDQFWNLVAESRLLGDEQYRAARDGCQESDSTLTADWLVEKKLISPLHRAVLLAGHAGRCGYSSSMASCRAR